MSMDKCKDCNFIVDTDADGNFYEIENPHGANIQTVGYCEKCRDKFLEGFLQVSA